MRRYQIADTFGIDALKMSEADVPRPSYGRVLVKMRAASLNYRDLLMIGGKYARNLPLPLVPLSDGAGEVVDVGPGVTRWAAGDRAMGTFFQDWIAGPITEAAGKSALGGAVDGVLAEYVLLREEGLVAIPDGLSFPEAATLPCAAVTAWNALTTGGLTSGDTVLTLGTGGVSIFAVQLAVAAGARVIGTSGSEHKMSRLKEMGVRCTVNYKQFPDWEKEVLQFTGGRGVDRVIEVGGAGTLGKSLKAVRTGGHISLIGVLTGQIGEINPLPAVMKSVRIQGIFVGSREMFENMLKAVTLHEIRPVIDRVFPFDEAREALRYMESGAHFGKVVIEF